MEALHLKKKKKASALYMSWLKCSLCRRYIIRIQMMTSLRNQAFHIFVESKFYGIMTIAISQQYYQGMWKKYKIWTVTKLLKRVNDSLQDKSNSIFTRKILQISSQLSPISLQPGAMWAGKFEPYFPSLAIKPSHNKLRRNQVWSQDY